MTEETIESTSQDNKQEWKFSIDGEYRPIELNALDEVASAAKIVIINDDHPSSFRHTSWVEMIKRLHGDGQQITMLFEMIKDNHQEGLTAYANNQINEATFKSQVYDKSWDWEYQRYTPYFRAVRELGLPAIAADLNREQQQLYSNTDEPVITYAGTRYVSPRAHKRDLCMTSSIIKEVKSNRKPVLLVGGAHFANQVKVLAEQYGVKPEEILLLSEYVDGTNTDGFIEFKPKDDHPKQIDKLRPLERR